MGLWDTIKGWFNIGGVKVKLDGVPSAISKTGNQIGGKVNLTAKGDKHVNKMTYRLVLRRTTGSGEKRETKDHVLAEKVVPDEFDMKKDETKVLDFTLTYALEKALKDMGGVLGGLGKAAAFLSGEKDEYFITATCSVKGTAFSPSDWQRVVVGD
jgi:SpoOM protein